MQLFQRNLWRPDQDASPLLRNGKRRRRVGRRHLGRLNQAAHRAGQRACTVHAHGGQVHARGFIFGILASIIVALVGGYLVLKSGFVPANADASPGRLELWAAGAALHAAIAREAPKTANPVALTDANLPGPSGQKGLWPRQRVPACSTIAGGAIACTGL